MSNSKLPTGWVETELKNCFLYAKSGGTPSTKNKNYYGGVIPFVKIDDISNGSKYLYDTNVKINSSGIRSSSSWIVPKNSLVYSMYASYGIPIINKKRVATSQAMINMIFTKDFHIDYIYYYLLDFKSKLSSYTKGTTQANLNAGIVNLLPIKVPPLNEQKRIVTKIEKLFSNLDNSDKYLAHLEKQLKRYRQSVLKSAFEGELTREWREKQSDLESAKDLLEKIKDERLEYIEKEVRSKFEDKTEKWIADKVKKEVDKFYKLLETTTNINNDLWINIPLEAITTLLGDGLHGTPKYVENSEYYFVNGNNLQHGKLLIKNDTKSVSEEEYLKYKKNMNLNTILVSINGTLGNIAFFNNEKVMLGKSACYFNLLKSINKQYIFWKINSHEFRTYADKSATGSTIKNLPLSAMRKYKVPICSNSEQQEIIKEIDKHMSIIDKLEAVVQKSIKESKRLRQSILKQAFEGKLVEQDSSDESAQILLEKIAKAKEEYKKEMSKRKKK